MLYNSDQIKVPNNINWLSTPKDIDNSLCDEIKQRVRVRIENKKYSEDDVKYVESYKPKLLCNKINISDKQLEKLRLLAKNWDVSLTPPKLTSHRKFIGPIIVGFKKVSFRILAILMKDFIKKQREFNAQTVEYLALCQSVNDDCE